MFPLRLFASVSITEIHYDPVDSGYTAGSLREFVEIYNSGPDTVDLEGYTITDGIEYTFPAGVQLASGAYLVIARDPTQPVWSSLTDKVFGPFEGKLSNGGEKLRLVRPDGTVVEELKYDNDHLWPTGADGYGSSLERISPDLPAGDPHSWRASLDTSDGSPGTVNSVMDTPPYPLLLSHKVVPEHPTSSDQPIVQICLDKTATIGTVTLRYETWTISEASYGAHTLQSTAMQLQAQDVTSITYEAQLPSFPSQVLVRFNVKVSLTDGNSLYLPHRAERRPFESFFIYDGEVNSSLPVLWKFNRRITNLTEAASVASGVVIKEPSAEFPVNYDGANLVTSRNGEKIHFIKGQEYQGNGTLNLVPERPVEGTTAGISSPHREDLAFWYYTQMGVLAPRADWFRVVVPPSGTNPTQTQRLGIEQINEEFLERNGRSLEGVLFKRNYVDPVWETHLNKELGTTAIYALQSAIQTEDTGARREVIEACLNYEEFMDYAVTTMLISNWDGYSNNNWMYKGPNMDDRWEIMTWDQDKAWGYTDSNAFFTRFPLTYPITGYSSAVSHEPGPVLGPLHEDETFYHQFLLRLRAEMDKTFTEESLFPRIESLRNFLLADLALLETNTGTIRDDRRSQINTSYNTIEAYITARRTYLFGKLTEYDPDLLPPFLTSATFVRGDQLLLSFDKELEQTSTETIENYTVTPGDVVPATATLVDSTRVVLILPQRMASGREYEISVVGIRDASKGNAISDPQSWTVSYISPQVSISEILYDNRGDDIEWVELHNTTSVPVEISGWYLSDDNVYPAQGEGKCVFPQGTILEASEYVVVNLWGVSHFNLWQFPSSVRVITPTVLDSGALSNGGDNLALYNAANSGALVDGSLYVDYPDLCRDGESLEKIDGDFPWGNPETVSYNFRHAVVPLGFITGIGSNKELLGEKGSPGRENGSELPLQIEEWPLY